MIEQETGSPDDVGSIEEPVYELRNVERHFVAGGNTVRALDGVDLDIAPADVVAIEGPSGSGKSTLLQLLGALDRSTAGTVLLGGVDLGTVDDKELTSVRAREIGFVFQTFNLIPTLSASENVEVAMVPLGVDAARRRARATELLEIVGLAGRAGHLPSLMSGGEQQRVAIARALANGPRVILADEPTGNLDSENADEIVRVLTELSADQGVTVVIVTHSADVAARARRRIRLRDGRIVA